MPITEAERKKIRDHRFSENVEGIDSTHTVVPKIPVEETIRRGFGLLASKPSSMLINIPGSLIFALYAFALLGSHSLSSIVLYTLLFFVLEIFIASPLSSVSKSRFANTKRTRSIDSMVISLIYLEPLVPAFFLGLVMVVLKSLSIFSPLYIFVFLVLLVIVVILYILNLDSSIAVYILHDKGARRDTALNRSWLFLSGQSLSVLSVNAVVYLPLVIAVIAEYLLEGSLFVWYLLPITFILADIASSWWEACTYHIYEVTKNKSKPMQYSKL